MRNFGNWLWMHSFWIVGSLCLFGMGRLEWLGKDLGACLLGILAAVSFAIALYEGAAISHEKQDAYDRAMALRSRRRDFKLIKGGKKG